MGRRCGDIIDIIDTFNINQFKRFIQCLKSCKFLIIVIKVLRLSDVSGSRVVAVTNYTGARRDRSTNLMKHSLLGYENQS